MADIASLAYNQSKHTERAAKLDLSRLSEQSSGNTVLVTGKLGDNATHWSLVNNDSRPFDFDRDPFFSRFKSTPVTDSDCQSGRAKKSQCYTNWTNSLGSGLSATVFALNYIYSDPRIVDLQLSVGPISKSGHSDHIAVLGGTEMFTGSNIEMIIPRKGNIPEGGCGIMNKNTWGCRGSGAAARCQVQPCVKEYKVTVEAGKFSEELLAQSALSDWGLFVLEDWQKTTALERRSSIPSPPQ